MQLIINYYINQNCISGDKLSMELKKYLQGIKINIETVVQKSKDNKDSKNLTPEQSSSSVSTSGPSSSTMNTLEIENMEKKLKDLETQINKERQISDKNLENSLRIIEEFGYNPFSSLPISSVSRVTSGQSTLGTSTLSSTSTPQSTKATVGLLDPIIEGVHRTQLNQRQNQSNSEGQSSGGGSFK